MIAKMRFVNIVGPQADLDRVVEKYISKYEIQIENAVTQLQTLKNVVPYVEENPYKELLLQAHKLMDMLETVPKAEGEYSCAEAMDMIKELNGRIVECQKQNEIVTQEKSHYQQLLAEIEPFQDIHYNVQQLLGFHFIKYRFGKIAREYYDKFEQYIYDDLETIFYKCQSTQEYVWGVYFVPASKTDKVDAVYASLHFERFYLQDEYEGTVEEAYAKLEQQIAQADQHLKELQLQNRAILSEYAPSLVAATQRLEELSSNFDIRKLAAYTKTKGEIYYILCGWMVSEDAKAFAKDVEEDEDVCCVIEDNKENIKSKPPTRLKNPKFFRPYEMFLRMYGLPNYNEFDPTMFIAITYSIIFGMMFGDVGQGICLCIGGFLLYKWKKIDLAAIIACCGVFSTVFGFMFGSVFGFEDMIEPLWLRPISAMTKLPFIGNLNTVFVFAIALGMGLVLLTMVFHIINGFRAKDVEAAWFDTNGIAGFLFYGAIVFCVVMFMTGHTLPSGIVLVVMFGLPLILIAMKEPLTAFITKRADLMPKQKGMFIVQTVFELFEVMLSYFSNTLSFVRIGAFAVSHAAMMEVVLMLAGAENGASPNWIVIVIGNLFVCGMEGLIVGIQVLRLEYYEFFSRFYKGGGREFKPYVKHR